MGRHEYMEQFDRRAKDEAAERSQALKVIAAICTEKSAQHDVMLGLEEWQADKNAIDTIRVIINELPE